LRLGLSPTQSESRFDEMLRQAGLVEELGYDVLWAHEHHSGAAMYRSPSMTLGGSARSVPEIDADHFIIGDASECIDKIAQYAELGIAEIARLMNFGAPEKDAVERSMRLFAERVLPYVSGL
jgi:alkanesulfonate monooxygenase SsuD/methylene tetrahydromethanopterin reductase-like flavin-dependent oxidoreductase (luciferase family)